MGNPYLDISKDHHICRLRRCFISWYVSIKQPCVDYFRVHESYQNFFMPGTARQTARLFEMHRPLKIGLDVTLSQPNVEAIVFVAAMLRLTPLF